MVKQIFIALMASMLLLGGCAGNARNNASQSKAESKIESRIEESVPPVEPEVSVLEEEPGENLLAADPLEGLTHNEYEQLEISADVTDHDNILPGASIPVNVTVTNKGDKTIAYIHGSGVYDRPEALVTHVTGLQPALPKDRLGAATMDFVTKELKPGESVTFTEHVMAIEPNERFDEYTYGYYADHNGYIAEADWPALQDLFGDLNAVEPGDYEGKIYFRYRVQDESDNNPVSEPTGYAQADFSITVNE